MVFNQQNLAWLHSCLSTTRSRSHRTHQKRVRESKQSLTSRVANRRKEAERSGHSGQIFGHRLLVVAHIKLFLSPTRLPVSDHNSVSPRENEEPFNRSWFGTVIALHSPALFPVPKSDIGGKRCSPEVFKALFVILLNSMPRPLFVG